MGIARWCRGAKAEGGYCPLLGKGSTLSWSSGCQTQNPLCLRGHRTPRNSFPPPEPAPQGCLGEGRWHGVLLTAARQENPRCRDVFQAPSQCAERACLGSGWARRWSALPSGCFLFGWEMRRGPGEGAMPQPPLSAPERWGARLRGAVGTAAWGLIPLNSRCALALRACGKMSRLSLEPVARVRFSGRRWSHCV